MAKKSKNAEPALQSWDDVDRCLREIGECEIAMGEVEAEMNIAINDIKEKATRLAKPMQANIAKLEAMVKEFAEDAKADMDAKSKQLNFGRVGFRQSSSVSVPNKKIEAILKSLKKFGMDDCIIVKETVNKEILERYPDKDIAKVGAVRKAEDKFWLEADKEKIRG